MLILSGSAAGDPAEMLNLWPAYFTRSEGVLPETRRFARGIAESVLINPRFFLKQKR
jgi:hypothetical protein